MKVTDSDGDSIEFVNGHAQVIHHDDGAVTVKFTRSQAAQFGLAMLTWALDADAIKEPPAQLQWMSGQQSNELVAQLNGWNWYSLVWIASLPSDSQFGLWRQEDLPDGSTRTRYVGVRPTKDAAKALAQLDLNDHPPVR